MKKVPDHSMKWDSIFLKYRVLDPVDTSCFGTPYGVLLQRPISPSEVGRLRFKQQEPLFPAALVTCDLCLMKVVR